MRKSIRTKDGSRTVNVGFSCVISVNEKRKGKETRGEGKGGDEGGRERERE